MLLIQRLVLENLPPVTQKPQAMKNNKYLYCLVRASALVIVMKYIYIQVIRATENIKLEFNLLYKGNMNRWGLKGPVFRKMHFLMSLQCLYKPPV